jgi:hypothetical protein
MTVRAVLTSLARLWHTACHLKPVQIYGRLLSRFPRPLPGHGPAPPRRERMTAWRAPASRRPSLFGPRRFRLLNEEHDLDEVGWSGPGVTRLWRYNQHYFDDLNADDAEMRATWHRALLDDWRDGNPPVRGPAWEPYPLSLRIVNLVKAELSRPLLSAAMEHSLARQCRALESRVEWHLLGNHLFSNAKALVFGGCFFDGPEADRWLKQGLAILAAQTPEQVLADGGHFERSPMYHALALEDLLDLHNLLSAYSGRLGRQDEAAQGWISELPIRIASMVAWLEAMTHPDGQIALFNDAAFGVAPSPADLACYASRLSCPRPSTASRLTASGYVRLERGPAVCILDVAPLGPDYLPAHGHADTLSFELSIDGARVLVDTGVSQYGSGPQRLRERGTAAHNTVTVAGRDSSEVWGGFRVARRAHPHGLVIDEDQEAAVVTCRHDGYARLPGRPVHARTWTLTAQSLTVIDEITAPLPAVSHWHWAPGCVIVPDPATAASGGQSCFTVRLPGGRTLSIRGQGLEWTHGDYAWHPEFGLSVPATGSAGQFLSSRSEVVIAW